MKKVYLSELVAVSVRERLAEHYEIVDNFDHPEEIEAIMIRQVEVTREVIERCPNLKVISMHGIGLDRIDQEAAKEHGVAVFNVPGMGAESVGELVVAYIMALSRNLKRAQNGLTEGRWKSFGPADLVGHELCGKTLGVIGMGNISRIVARIMKNAFDCRIIGYDPYTDEEKAELSGFEKVETVRKLMGHSDFISISVPLTNSTRNMINKEVFECAKPNLILINTARGGIVNEDDLYEALTTGKIAGAALDVTVQEPIDKNNPLLKLENFMCSPHIGGSTYEGRERVGQIAVDHIMQVLNPELLR